MIKKTYKIDFLIILATFLLATGFVGVYWVQYKGWPF